MVQPDRPGSPGSFTPLSFRSLNLIPAFVACSLSLHDALPIFWPEVRVTAKPPWPRFVPVAETMSPVGEDSDQPLCRFWRAKDLTGVTWRLRLPVAAGT